MKIVRVKKELKYREMKEKGLKVVYKRERFHYSIILILLLGILAYLGHSWFLWIILSLLILVEHSNRPSENIYYKEKSK